MDAVVDAVAVARQDQVLGPLAGQMKLVVDQEVVEVCKDGCYPLGNHLKRING